MRSCIVAVTALCGALATASAAVNDIALATVAEGRLSIRARAVARVFAPNAPVEIVVIFKNTAEAPLSLPVTSFLGTTTLGLYRYEVRELATGEIWRIGLDLNAPLPAEGPVADTVRLQPGDSYVTRFALPGAARQFWQGADSLAPTRTAQNLGVGDYELTIEMSLPTEQTRVGPIPFGIAVIPPAAEAARAPRPPAAVSRAADALLAERLAFYRRAHRNAPPWNSLTTASFQSTARRVDEFWEIEYLADAPARRQRVRFQALVSEAGKPLNPNASFLVMTSRAVPPQR